MSSMSLSDVLQMVLAVASVLVAAASVAGAMRSGVLQKIRFGPMELETSPREREQVRDLVKSVSTGEGTLPFETEQLALYYGQVLSQSRISFWFSLVFASIGFLILVIAVFTYSSDKMGTTVAQFIAGTIVDAVATLFFVQSKNAQKSMGEFFDKLRRDRNHLESRKLCDSIEDHRGRDALRIQLSLHYAEMPEASVVGKAIIDTTVKRYDG